MTIENLEIEVEASSDKATSSLEKLEAVLRKIDSLGNSKGFNKLYRRLKRIADLDFTRAAKGFDALLSRVGAAYRPARAMENLAKHAADARVELIKTEKATATFNTGRKNGQYFNSSYENIEDLRSEYINFGELFRDFGANVPRLEGQVKYFDGLRAELERLSWASAGADKKMSYLGKTIYRFLTYKALNTVIRGISSGFQNIALYSKEANETLTKYKSLTTQIGNTLAATLVPILNAMYPLIGGLSDILIDTANSVNLLFSMFGGTYRRAKKYTDDYAKSLGKVKSSVGMDEIHTLGNNSQKYSEMFEDVKITGLDIAGATAKIMGLVAAVTLLQQAFTGKNWLGATVLGFGNLKSNVQKALAAIINLRTDAPKLSKALGVAGVAGGTALATTGAYNLTKALGEGNGGLAGGLVSLVSGGAMAVLGGFMVGGPVGAVVGGLIALAGAAAGAVSAAVDMRYELLKTDYYDVQGTKISEVKDALDSYFAALNFDKQNEWIEKIKDSQTVYDDAKGSYEEMWSVISKKQDLDTSDIDGLTDSFNELVEAAQALNSVRIDSLMESISSGIKLNLTDELNERLGELTDKLAVAKSILNTNLSSVKSEYQEIIAKVAANGGVASEEDKAQLDRLREDIQRFTLSDDTGAARWTTKLEDAKNGAINAGGNKDEILSNVNSLISDRDTYLSDLAKKYEEDRISLQALIAKDKFLGKILGIADHADEYKAAMKEAYDKKVSEVNSQYEAVINQIIETYAKGALDYDKYHTGSGVLDALETGRQASQALVDFLLWGVWHGSTSPDFSWNASKELSEEQKALLDELHKALDRKPPGYATGGFPEDGLFMANSRELIGQFSNGKTAVANNEQIIEGIKRGVMEANMETGGNGGDWTIQIVDTDGRVKAETIITATERRNRRDGKTVIALGV